MKRAPWIALSATTTILMMSIVLFADDVFAGPPLLCHAIEIGEAESLPWGDGTWQNDKITLSDADFVARTLALLSPEAAVLTRMETIRRATIHAAEYPEAARELMSVVRSRVHAAEHPSAMSVFDLGYLMATFGQMNMVTEHNSTGYSGGQRKVLSVAGNLNAYELLKKAASLSSDVAPIEFALALLTLSPSHPAHRSHLQNAITGATAESLLAANLVMRFGRNGQTLDDLRTNYGMVADGERR